MKVRLATTKDIPWIIPQLKEFAPLYNTKKSLYGTDKYSIAYLNVLINEHVAIIAEKDDGTCVGFIMGRYGKHPFNQKIKILAEVFWYVLPKHRSSRAALMLLNAYVKIGKQIADFIYFSLQDERTNIKSKSLLKRGFKMQEKIFLMEAN